MPQPFKLSAVRTILFDFDGTLVDASEAICASFNEALRSRGLPPRAESALRPMIGKPLREMFQLAGAADSAAALDDCIQAYRAVFPPLGLKMSRLLPGVRETLPRLARFAKLGIVTNRMGDGARQMLEAHGMDSHFQSIVGIERVSQPKPHPEPVLLGLTDLTTHPSHGVMVGDTTLDILAAMQADVLAVGITTGSCSAAELHASGALRVIDGIAELLDAIDA